MLPFVKFSMGHLFGSPAYSPAEMAMYYEGTIKNAYTDVGDLVRALACTLVATLFVYALTVFAGVITGTTSLHIIVAAVLNVAALAFYLIVTALTSEFLYGYYSEATYSIARFLHPAIAFIISQFRITSPAGIAEPLLFIAISAAFSAAAFILYKKLKSERVGRPFTFEIAEYAFIIIVTLCGMTICGLMFAEVGGAGQLRDERFLFYGGAIIGAIVTYMAATMVARKSTRIFDMRLLRNFGVYAICAVLFLVCTTTDITGYEKRIPEAAAVKSVEVGMPLSFNIIPYRWGYSDTKVRLADKEGIEAVTALHKVIADAGPKFSVSNNKYYIEDSSMDTFEESAMEFMNYETQLTLKYKRNGGGFISRIYDLNPKVANTKQLRNLIGSKSWRKASTMGNLYGYKLLRNVDVIFGDSGHMLENDNPAFEKKLTDSEVRELAAHLDADYMKISTDDLISRSLSDEILTFEFSWVAKKGHDSPPYITYSVTAEYTETIKWLKENGWYEDMVRATGLLKAEAVKYYNERKASENEDDIMVTPILE
jgi:hypothetical protein